MAKRVQNVHRIIVLERKLPLENLADFAYYTFSAYYPFAAYYTVMTQGHVEHPRRQASIN